MAAFQAGFSMGQTAYQRALDNQDREERRKAEAEERALRMEQIRLGLDAARTAAERDRQVDALSQQLTRPNAENYTLAAPAKSGLRMPEAAPAPAMDGATAAPVDGYALTAQAPKADGIAMPEAQTTPAGTIKVAPDTRQATFNAAPTRGAAEDILARMALIKGDTAGYRAAMGNKRTMELDDLVAGKMKEYTGSDEQIGASAAWLNESSQRITMGDPDKNGLVRMSVVRPDRKAEFIKLSKADQAKLYAAGHLMEMDPARALAMIGDVNKTLADAVAADRGLVSTLAGNANDVAGKTATITHTKNADARGAAAESRAAANDADARAEKARQLEKERKLIEARGIYEGAVQRGDPVAIRQARRGLIDAGGTAPEADKVETDFKPNPMGMGGTAVQRNRDGTIIVTPVDSTGKQGKTLMIPKPGAQATPAGLAADPRAIAIRDDPKLTIEEKREKLKALGYQ